MDTNKMLSFSRLGYYHHSLTHLFKNMYLRSTMHQALCQLLGTEQYTKYKMFYPFRACKLAGDHALVSEVQWG